MTLSLSPYVLFFSFSVLEFFIVIKSFNGVSRLFKGCLKFKGSFKEVLRVFTESFMGVSTKIEGRFR